MSTRISRSEEEIIQKLNEHTAHKISYNMTQELKENFKNSTTADDINGYFN